MSDPTRGTRQPRRTFAPFVAPRRVAPAASWWTAPDANFQKEAERMHAQDTSDIRNLIAWRGVGTSTGIGISGLCYMGSPDA